MSQTPLRQGRSPLYLQLTEVLRQRLARGVWAEGEKLPTIEQLTSEYKVSKITVRQAIKILEEEGLVFAQRGRGTTVLARPDGLRPLKVETSLTDLVEMYRGDEADLILLDDTKANLPEGDYGGSICNSGYHMLRRVHARKAKPYCIITLYFAKPLFEKHEARLRKDLALPVLWDEPEINVATARQTMLIDRCDMETAKLIDLEIGAPIAEVRRVLCDNDGTIIYLADVIYRGDYIRLDMDLLA